MSRRRLNDDERDLWKGVTRSISPLRKLRPPDEDDDAPATAPVARTWQEIVAWPSMPMRDSRSG